MQCWRKKVQDSMRDQDSDKTVLTIYRTSSGIPPRPPPPPKEHGEQRGPRINSVLNSEVS